MRQNSYIDEQEEVNAYRSDGYKAMTDEEYEEQQRRIRRQKKIARMRREKARYERRMKVIILGIPALFLLVLCVFLGNSFIKHRQNIAKENELWTPNESKNPMEKQEEGQIVDMLKAADGKSEDADDENAMAIEGEDRLEKEEEDNPIGETTDAGSSIQAPDSYAASQAKDLQTLSGEVVSTSAIVIDRNGEKVISHRDGYSRINPASMTKILTVLVAAEHVTDLDDTFTITRDITDYGYVNDCSSAGFLENEQVTIRDLMYGTILPSGADAAVGLATYVAGSHEAFVDMMNEKIKELGLDQTTHFTNCVGIYNENHYSTAYDMAMILEAAVDNPICREVMSAHVYTTSVTEQHPEGIVISNWFLRRIEDKDTCGEVVCAKTGYVVQSGSCAASYSENDSGKRIVCVTAGSTSSWRCIYDHVAVYQQFMK